MSSEDVVSYLDIADAYRRLDWKAAVNGYWSPLYSWVLALSEWLFRPAPAWELQFVRFVNFAIFLIALAAFEFFLQQLIASHEAAVLRRQPARAHFVIPRWMWRLCGYNTFLWACLIWIGLRSDTPDLCATALVLAAAGIMLRTDIVPPTRGVSVALGAVAGLAYLAKTAMFPIGFLFVAGLSGCPIRRTAERMVWATIAFAVVTIPFIVGLSLVKHRLTIGDSGRMNYVWNVNPGGYIVPGLHWQGGPAESGMPIHPTRRIWTEPAVFEFEHGEQTYAPWTDPSYWYDGLRVRFSAAAQLPVVASNAAFYGDLFLPALVVLAAVLLFGRALTHSMAALVADNWKLLLVSVGGLLTYLFATNLSAANIPTQPSTRYVAIFIVLMFAAIASGIRLPNSGRSRGLLTAVTLVVAVTLGGRLAMWSAYALTTVARPAPAEQLWQVVLGLRDLGVGSGSKVAILGRKGDHEFWARIGRIKIISQIPDPDAFLHAGATVQTKVLAALARTGAAALICDEWSASHPGLPWQRIGATRYYAIRLADYRESRVAAR